MLKWCAVRKQWFQYIVEGMNIDAVSLPHAPGMKTSNQLADDATGLVVANEPRGLMDIYIDLPRSEPDEKKNHRWCPYWDSPVIGRVRETVRQDISRGNRGPRWRFEDHGRWQGRKSIESRRGF